MKTTEVWSVPHTGTRTLLHHLGLTQFRHFGQNEADMWPGVAVHVPVRDPLATSISWRSYYPDREDFDEFRRWGLAIDRLGDCEDVTFHKIEELPVYEGQSGAHWAKEAYRERDLERLLTLPEIPLLLDWLRDWRDFFGQWYSEDELWYAR